MGGIDRIREKIPFGVENIAKHRLIITLYNRVVNEPTSLGPNMARTRKLI